MCVFAYEAENDVLLKGLTSPIFKHQCVREKADTDYGVAMTEKTCSASNHARKKPKKRILYN